MINQVKCPKCGKLGCSKNGKTHPDKFGRKKQNYKCTKCGKTFTENRTTLSRTEKRLFSLLYNLIHINVNKNDNLRTIAKRCNKEVNLIGKLDLEILSDEKFDINSLEDIKMVICANNNKIKIIKIYPEPIVMSLSEFAARVIESQENILENL